MDIKIFAVYDSAAKAYLKPFFSPTLPLARRMFSEAVNTAGSQFEKYAACYTLFEIGLFDDQTGQIDSMAIHTNLGNGLVYIEDALHDGIHETVSLKEAI